MCQGPPRTVRCGTSRYLGFPRGRKELDSGHHFPPFPFLTAHPSITRLRWTGLRKRGEGRSRVVSWIATGQFNPQPRCTERLRCVNLLHSANIEGQRRATGHASAFESARPCPTLYRSSDDRVCGCKSRSSSGRRGGALHDVLSRD